jgi:hypothetical protein
MSGWISGSTFLAISISLQASRRPHGSNSIVDSVNIISPRFQLSSLDRGTVSLLLSHLLISEGHRFSNAAVEFGFRSSVSVLESRRLGRSRFTLLNGTGPVVQLSGQFSFSRSISVSRFLSRSDLLAINSILDRNSSNHYMSNEAAESTMFMESLRFGHSDLAGRSSNFGSITRADCSLGNRISQMKSSSSYPRASFPFVTSGVLKATLSLLLTLLDHRAADSSRHSGSQSLVTSASGGGAATVSFGASGWNSTSDSFTVSSALSASAGAQGSRVGSIWQVLFAVLAVFLFLLLVSGCIICLLWKRRRSTDQSDLDYPLETEARCDDFLMEDSDSNDSLLGTYENPDSSSVNRFTDSSDEQKVPFE